MGASCWASRWGFKVICCNSCIKLFLGYTTNYLLISSGSYKLLCLLRTIMKASCLLCQPPDSPIWCTLLVETLNLSCRWPSMGLKVHERDRKRLSSLFWKQNNSILAHSKGQLRSKFCVSCDTCTSCVRFHSLWQRIRQFHFYNS